MAIHIVIPFFPEYSRFEKDNERLILFLELLKDRLNIPITVSCAPGLHPNVPSGVAIAHATLVEESRNASLPVGWRESASVAPKGNRVILLSHHSNVPDRDTISRAFELMDKEGSDVVVSGGEVRNHPCQFSWFCNVEQSAVFLPIDEEAAHLMHFPAIESNEGIRALISEAFPFPWGDWGVGDTPHRFFKVIPGVPAFTPILDMKDSQYRDGDVFLWREATDRARQINIECTPVAAIPLLQNSKMIEEKILEATNDAWSVQTKGDTVQVLPLEKKHGWTEDCLALHRRQPNVGASSIKIPRQAGAFLLNCLMDTEPPYSDIELPYAPEVRLWNNSLKNFDRSTSEGVIFGRQMFPQIFDFQNAFIALSERAAQKSLDSLPRRRVSCLPIMGTATCGDSFNSPTGENSPNGPPSGEKWEKTEPDEPNGARNGESGKASFENRLAALSERAEKAGLGLIRLWASQAVIAAARSDKGLFPMQAHKAFVEKKRKRLDHEAHEVAVAVAGLLEDEKSLTGETIPQRIESLLAACLRLGLSTQWLYVTAWQLYEAVDFSVASACIEQACRFYGGAKGLRARIALEKCIPAGRVDHAKALYEKEHALGWLSPLQTLKFANVLALFGRRDEAKELVKHAYEKDDKVRNGFANVGFRIFSRASDGAEVAYELLQQDVRMGRATSAVVLYEALFLTMLGRVEDAIEKMKDYYQSHGKLPSGGFLRFGWVDRVVMRHTFDGLERFIELDKEMGCSGVYWTRLAFEAFRGNLQKACRSARQLYNVNRNKGIYLAIGLAHWLRRRDDEVLYECIKCDYKQNRLYFYQRAMLLYLRKSPSWIDPYLSAATQREMAFSKTFWEKEIIAYFYRMGFRDSDISLLLHSSHGKLTFTN